MKAAFQQATSKTNAPVDMMQYGAMKGPQALRECIAEWISRASGRSENLPVPDNILVTTGSGSGMSMVAQLFSRPGQLIFVDSPGYFLAYYTFIDCGLSVINIPTDAHGMDVDAVENLLQQGKIPSLLYTVPMSNNPTGVSMSEERKRKLVALAREYNFKISTLLPLKCAVSFTSFKPSTVTIKRLLIQRSHRFKSYCSSRSGG